MYNSTIRQIVGKCSDCAPDSKEKRLVKGRCAYHYSAFRNKVAIERIKTREQSDKSELGAWFNFHMTYSPRKCENCGASLLHYNDAAWKGSQHHLFEKSIFPSVKTNLNNHMVLGMWCCHDKVSKLPSAIKDMPCFELAKKRVQKFINSVAKSEQRRIADYWY